MIDRKPRTRAAFGTLFFFLLLAGVDVAPSGAVDRLPTFHGAVIARGWNEAEASSPGSRRAEEAFVSLARAGASAVAVDVVALVARADSPFLENPRTPREVERARLAWTVERARHHGLRPVLRARVDRLDGGPRSAIAMTDDEAWERFFDQLRAWCTEWAREAEALGFDLFVLPSDLGGTTHREADWRRLVAAVRARYRGPLTYGAEPVDEVRRIAFWDEFDAIGVTTVPPVRRPSDDDPSPRPKPSVWSAADEDSVAVHEIARALDPVIENLDVVVQRFERPVIATGIGIRSVSGAWRIVDGPIDRFAPPDDRAQARAIGGVLKSLRDRPWLRGVLWRHVDLDGSDPEALRKRARSVSIVGKPSGEVLQTFWRRPTPDGGGRRVVGRGGMVVSEDSLATRAGRAILREGGNAFDAAVTMAFVLGVTRPDAVGLGGGGTAVVHDPRRGSRWIDFRARAPWSAHEGFFEELSAQGIRTETADGPIVAAVPGFVDGMYGLWSRGASFEWDRLLRPAFRAAADGFALSSATAEAMTTHRRRLQGYASTRAVFLPDGHRPRAGETVRRPRLAETLLALRREGPTALRHGPRARALIDGIERAGGIWTLEDAEQTAPAQVGSTTRWPLTRDGRVELHTRRDVRPTGFDPRAAWEDLQELPAGAPSSAVISRWVQHLEPLDTWNPAEGWHATGGTGFAVVDAEGRAVVVQLDMGRPFGCAWVEPTSGVLLNASMVRFDLSEGPVRTAVRPGVRAPSTAAPALVVRDGRVAMGLAPSDGGDTDLLPLLRRVLVDRWPLERALAAPRLRVGPVGPITEATRVAPWPTAARGADAGPVLAFERARDGTTAAALDPRGTAFALPMEAWRIRPSRPDSRSW